MTQDIKELVKRLRANLTGRLHEIVPLTTEAADALEALAGEVERLKDACKYDGLNAGAIAEIRRACKEIMGGNVTFVDDDFARCLFTLSAERDRLKAALVAISEGDKPTTYMHLGTALAIARKALGDAS